jgi:hypothetical protein
LLYDFEIFEAMGPWARNQINIVAQQTNTTQEECELEVVGVVKIIITIVSGGS